MSGIFISTDKSLISIEIPLAIGTYDIDAAGHVNNIVYIRWLEDMRIKLFTALCDFQGIYNNKYFPVVISTEIKYRKQLKIFDEPTGLMEYAGHSHGIITLKAFIKLGNVISAHAEQKCIMLNLSTNKMINDKMITQLFESNINK
jgi:acyl-CoA thioester hydrolase